MAYFIPILRMEQLTRPVLFLWYEIKLSEFNHSNLFRILILFGWRYSQSCVRLYRLPFTDYRKWFTGSQNAFESVYVCVHRIGLQVDIEYRFVSIYVPKNQSTHRFSAKEDYGLKIIFENLSCGVVHANCQLVLH